MPCPGYLLANDIGRHLGLVTSFRIVLSRRPHFQSFHAFLRSDDRSAIRIEARIGFPEKFSSTGPSRLQQADYFQCDCWRSCQSRTINASNVDHVGILVAGFNDPVSAVALRTCSAKGMNRFFRVKGRNETFAFRQNVLLYFPSGHAESFWVVDISGCRPQDEVAPESCLNQDSFSKDWIRAGKHGVFCQLPLLSSNIVLQAG